MRISPARYHGQWVNLTSLPLRQAQGEAKIKLLMLSLSKHESKLTHYPTTARAAAAKETRIERTASHCQAVGTFVVFDASERADTVGPRTNGGSGLSQRNRNGRAHLGVGRRREAGSLAERG